MRILIAPQELKGSLSAVEAARAIGAGVARALPDARVVLLPVGDGGPGTMDALVAAAGGEHRRVTVSGPQGRPVCARYGVIGSTAVVETAEACGLTLLKGERLQPATATTYGVGEIVCAALDAGLRRFLIGLGGSATNDGAAGTAQALGFRLLDAEGHELPRGVEALTRLRRIDAVGADPRLCEAAFEVAADVRNPLSGTEGTTALYGAQKGVLPDQVPVFDAALRRLARVIERDLGRPVLEMVGGGAGGGQGAGWAGFFGARLRPGFALVAEALDLERHCAAANLIITGEGRLDAQTVYGKAVAGVAELGLRYGVPVVALVGSVARGFEVTSVPGLTAAFSLCSGPISLEEAEARAFDLLSAAAEQCARLAGRMGNPASSAS
jgi:glycerate kinase